MHLKYRPDIDGLRALAVLSVIVFHLNSHWLHGGFVGVDVFFVISGFLITKIIYSDIINQQFSFKEFYQRRINRILPVFFVVMFCTAFVAWYLLLPDELMLFLKSLKTTTYFWENMFFAKNTGGYWDLSAEQMPILHTWSLAVEEQFYILLPFLLLFLIGIQFQAKKKLFRFNKIMILMILAIIGLISFLLAQFSPKSVFLTQYNYYSLFTARAGELLIGSIIGIISVKNAQLASENISENRQKTSLILKNSLTGIGFLMLVGSIIFLSEKNLFPSFWALLPTIGAALMIFCYDKNTIVAKLLAFKPLVFIGTISYSLYLWHWPIIVLARKYLYVEQFVSVKQYLIVIATMILLSLCSYFFIEKPCRKHKKSFKFSFILYYLIPTLIIFGVYEMQKKTKSLDFGYEKRLENYELMKKRVWESGEYGGRYIKNIFGDVHKKPEILFIGDSYAEAYLPYLDMAGKMYHFSFQTLISHQCPMLLDISNAYKENNPNEHKTRCVDVIPQEIEKAIQQNYKVVVYVTNFINYENKDFYKNRLDYSDNLKEFGYELKKHGQTLIILDRVRDVNNDELRRYYNLYLKNKPFYSTNLLMDRDKSANNNLKNKLKNDAIFFNPINGLSAEQLLEWPLYNGLMTSADGGHLNGFVTRQWSQEVLPKQKEFWEGILNLIDNESVNPATEVQK